LERRRPAPRAPGKASSPDSRAASPQDAGAPLYLARVVSAFEDTSQEGGDRLCIEVQWYERRANMPPHLQEGMHEREVVESLQTDTNLVGCIERKARVIRARSHEEAAALMSINHPGEAGGEWHFCRGVLNCDDFAIKTYEDVEAGALTAGRPAPPRVWG
jgi:hypothetical protein